MHQLLLEFLIIAVGTVVMILSGSYLAFTALGVTGGYDANECFRLMRVIDDKEVRQELTRWVDKELDVASLDWVQIDEETYDVRPLAAIIHEQIKQKPLDMRKWCFQTTV